MSVLKIKLFLELQLEAGSYLGAVLSVAGEWHLAENNGNRKHYKAECLVLSFICSISI